MSAVLRVAGLAGIYLLVLTSVDPWDVAIGLAIGGLVVAASRPSGRHRGSRGWVAWAAAFVRMLGVTAWEIVLGTARVVRFCLTDTGSPGFVTIPRGDRSRRTVALWGVLTGESPDEYPVAVDDAAQALIVHNVDARDPAAILARHAAADERYQREVSS